MFDYEKLRASIPLECEISLSHAQIHLDSAKCAQVDGDLEQLAHDAGMAGCILLMVCHYTDTKLMAQAAKNVQGKKG